MKKVSFLQFLFRIGDDYLMFLRNLTPAVLFLSLALFMYSELNWTHWAWSNVLVLFLSLASGFTCTQCHGNKYRRFCTQDAENLKNTKRRERT